MPKGRQEQVSRLRERWLYSDKCVSCERLVRIFKDHGENQIKTRQLFKVHKLYPLFVVSTAMRRTYCQAVASVPRSLRRICLGMQGTNGQEWIELAEAALQLAKDK